MSYYNRLYHDFVERLGEYIIYQNNFDKYLNVLNEVKKILEKKSKEIRTKQDEQSKQLTYDLSVMYRNLNKLKDVIEQLKINEIKIEEIIRLPDIYIKECPSNCLYLRFTKMINKFGWQLINLENRKDIEYYKIKLVELYFNIMDFSILKTTNENTKKDMVKMLYQLKYLINLVDYILNKIKPSEFIGGNKEYYKLSNNIIF
jgi:hypothetical protein